MHSRIMLFRAEYLPQGNVRSCWLLAQGLSVTMCYFTTCKCACRVCGAQFGRCLATDRQLWQCAVHVTAALAPCDYVNHESRGRVPMSDNYSTWFGCCSDSIFPLDWVCLRLVRVHVLLALF